MAEQQREHVYCHACQNEWLQDDHGLQCPNCRSDVVEIVSLSQVLQICNPGCPDKGTDWNHTHSIEDELMFFQIDERNDPRDNHITISDDDSDRARLSTNTSDDSLPRHPLHHHNPWQTNPPDPDESDIEHVEWNPAPGVHFTARSSYRSTTPGQGRRSQGEPLPPLFQTFSTMFEGPVRRPPGSPRIQHVNRMNRPEFPSQSPFPDHLHRHHHVHPHQHAPWPPSGATGGRGGFTTTGPFPGNNSGNNFHAYVHRCPSDPSHLLWSCSADTVNRARLVATVLQSMHTGMMEQGHDAEIGAPNMYALFSSILGNGTHGDAVYTDEALDRIITQMMDQQNANGAPGPASAAAIAALPKQKADKSMMGHDGKAECSVCMDAVEIGDEVTMLPCKHWFHGDCVGAWLKEHDTCPHCRQGIMPKDAPEAADTPRSPDQEPRHNQPPFSIHHMSPPSQPGQQTPVPGAFNHPGMQQRPMPGAFPQPGMQQPYMPGGFPQYPEPRNYVTPPGQHQGPHVANSPSLQPQQQNQQQFHNVHRRRSSARERSGGNGGEGSSSGQGVTGWFRSRLGGGSSGGDR